MKNFTKNEIVALLHLADGEQHENTPSALSEKQYYEALKSLQSRGMVNATFREGEEVESSQIKESSQAVLKNLKSAGQ